MEELLPVWYLHNFCLWLKTANRMAKDNRTEEQIISEIDQLRQMVDDSQSQDYYYKKLNDQLQAEIANRKRAEEHLQKQSHELGERIKELNCLYGLGKLVEKHDSLEKIFQGTAELIPPSWQYPDLICARIIALGSKFESKNFRQTEWKQTAEITVHDRSVGKIEVFYTEQCPDADEGPFITEERNLINALSERLSRIIERKQAEEQVSEYQKQLQQMGSKMAMSEERQRREIATRLHDNIGQYLALTVLKLDTLKKSITSKDTVAELDEIHKTIEKAIQDTRTLSFDLSSPILYRFGFMRAIEQWISEQVRKKYGIKTKFIKDGQVKQLDEETNVVLYQATREVLINVIKHARAKFVEVSVIQIDGKIEVIVEDDGVGFEISEIGQFIHKSSGFGLFNVRERLNYFGGDIRIESKPENGTRVVLTIPAKAEKNNGDS